MHILKYNPFDYWYYFWQKIWKKVGIRDNVNNRLYWLAWRFFRLVAKIAFKWEATGYGNFPKEGGCVIIFNHNHAFDPFIGGTAVHRKIRYVAKRALFKTPILKSMANSYGCIPLVRNSSDQQMLLRSKKVLREGGILGMFPEGTRSKTGKLQKFHVGSARLCLEEKVPYCPIIVTGTHKIKIGHIVRVYVGKPRYPDPNMEANYENAVIFTELMQKDISDMVAKYDTGKEFFKAKALSAFKTKKNLHDIL